ALYLLVLSVAAGGGGPGRPGADSARVATLLAALAQTDPVICDLIGDQLGNFWIGDEPGRLGRFDDAPNVQGAKDSLAGRITDPRAVSLLVATLGSDTQCVRRVAAKLLGHSAVSANVLGSLLENASPRIRESAAYAAGVGERHETRGPLERRLADSASGPAAMAAWALGEIQDPASAPALQGAVHSPSPRVRLASAWALGRFEDASYAKDVLPLLRDVDPVMRATAAEALGDEEVDVRREAASAIGDLDEVTKAPAALVHATTSPDLDLRRHATKALAHIGDLATVQALVDRLGDDDKSIRLAAVEGLGEMKVAAALPGLTRALNDRDPEVRRAAAEALGETDN